MNKKSVFYVIAIIAVVVIFATVSSNIAKNKEMEKKKQVAQETNYWTNDEGALINTSEKIDETKVVEDLSIEKSEITTKNGISTLEAKVINNGGDKTNLKFKVKFFDNNSNELTEITALVGNLKAGATGYINAGFPTDVSNAKEITYEIIK
ncbi:MAG: FxLYD domain-containing protein [Clostridia bacterium]|nr:FxLYD domain-containing protein [Clostridia bacterium]MDD4387503.1 FxLYD domain-containing protein [Clostridia bacterium]